MERLREKWWVALIVTLALAGVIFGLAPRYTDAQVAGTPKAFLDAVADAGDGRTIAAAVVDMLFVGAYLTLAVALRRDNVASASALGLMLLAGLADVTENALVIRAVAMGDDVTQATVDTIRRAGSVKWTGVIVGGIVMLIGLFLNRRASGVDSSDA